MNTAAAAAFRLKAEATSAHNNEILAEATSAPNGRFVASVFRRKQELTTDRRHVVADRQTEPDVQGMTD